MSSKNKVDQPLTEKQRSFVNLVVENDGSLSKTECARLAGYEERSAYQRAYELTNPKICPHVVKALSEYREEYLGKYNVTYDNHIAQLAKIKEMAIKEKMYGVAGRMEELRGKARGLYVEKQMNVNKTVDDLSAEELEKKMQDLLDENKLMLGGEEDDKSKEN